MKNKSLFIALFSCLLAPLSAQTSDLPFKGGEWLRFKVKYGVFNASIATMSLKEEMYGGEKSVSRCWKRGYYRLGTRVF